MRLTQSGINAINAPVCTLPAPPLPIREKRVQIVKPDPAAGREVAFDAAVNRLYGEGILTGHKGAAPIKIAHNCTACKAEGIGWAGAARELAAILPGQLMPSVSKTGVHWQLGRADAGNLVDPGLLPSLYSSQDIVQRLIPGSAVKWSHGGNARILLDYVGEPETDGKRSPAYADILLDGITYGYHECKPGSYQFASHYDVTAYYYTMLKMMPSIRLLVLPDGIIFRPMPDAEMDRWKQVLSCVAGSKSLRNTLAGVMAGSTAKKDDGELNLRVYYYRDKSHPPGPGEDWPVIENYRLGAAGPFRAAGLLCVRTGYEKTLQESRQNNTIYANIDSVIVTGSRVPHWETFGFTTKCEYAGSAHIIGRGSWRVGKHETKIYTRDNTALEPTDRPVSDPAIQYGNWL